jgi:hypothetical protein
MTTKQQMDELLMLWEKYAEGKLGEDDALRLEELVKSDPELMRLFVNTSHQHACLAINPEVASPCTFGHDLSALVGDGAVEPGSRPVAPPKSVFGSGYGLFLRIAALLVAGFGVGYLLSRQQAPEAVPDVNPVAVMSETVHCQWAGGSLPTDQGTVLSPGRLRLSSGLATLIFKSGAKVVMEGPADLELVSPMKCKLHSGLVVAEVPKLAINFEIETPKARVFDLGTEFVLAVNPKGDTQVRVIKGLVEAQPNQSPQRHPVKGGQSAIIENERDFRLESSADGEMRRTVKSGVEPVADNSLRISTADGTGDDAYVAQTENPYKSDTLLLVKHGGYFRKAYLAFDLAKTAHTRIENAVLQLMLEPSGIGTGAGLPDCVFKVYGVTDEKLDSWTGTTITWANAPANALKSNSLYPSSSVLLGSFTVPKGIQQGLMELNGEKLVNFLNSDTNGRVSLVIIRETAAKPAGDLVHAFAGRRHSGAQPPTLRLWLAKAP